ncbi:hypothetical protein CC77DRAFT_297956 [Alternaria alternata]|uniref:Uncharacterized protein n=1 Tax=Alternaria alternata TaxID=5599 RepID=A0A177DZY8_ALTAL|nr:hypothetical protein CC77DRAFT_297956 [Alternaria alternata]OAG25036.1 hypothetical protein CC77DRAFT_297956 [Alternaria alternata]
MGHGVEAHLVRLTEACQWRYLIPTACIMLFLVFRRNYTESLTILRGLGVQTSTTSLTYLQTLLPRRETLEIVWRGVRGGLWEDSMKSADREKNVESKAAGTVES